LSYFLLFGYHLLSWWLCRCWCWVTNVWVSFCKDHVMSPFHWLPPRACLSRKYTLEFCLMSWLWKLFVRPPLLSVCPNETFDLFRTLSVSWERHRAVIQFVDSLQTFFGMQWVVTRSLSRLPRVFRRRHLSGVTGSLLLKDHLPHRAEIGDPAIIYDFYDVFWCFFPEPCSLHEASAEVNHFEKWLTIEEGNMQLCHWSLLPWVGIPMVLLQIG